MHVLIAGAGGNIGSHLVPHVARMPGVERITLIDRDDYEAANVRAQNIAPGDVGRSKAVVQAERARAVAPALSIEPIVVDLETLPLGRFRADLILACLDSRRARQAVNEVAVRLSLPWIDAGVHGDDLLVRIDVYAPGPGGPCLECGWSEADYAALEQAYPCGPGLGVPTTGAPSELGALAASLQAIECEKLLRGDPRGLAPGDQVVLDAGHHGAMRTIRRVNPACRLGAHEPWEIDVLEWDPAAASVEDLVAEGRLRHPEGALSFAVAARPFVQEATCSGCQRVVPVRRFTPAHTPEIPPCDGCGAGLVVAGWAVEGGLGERAFTPAELAQPLAALGIRPLDVITVASDAAASARAAGAGDVAAESRGRQSFVHLQIGPTDARRSNPIHGLPIGGLPVGVPGAERKGEAASAHPVPLGSTGPLPSDEGATAPNEREEPRA